MLCPHVPGTASSAGHSAESKTNRNLIFVLTHPVVYWGSYRTPPGASLKDLNELLEQTNKKVFFPCHESMRGSLKKKNEVEIISDSSHVEEGNPQLPRGSMLILGEII